MSNPQDSPQDKFIVIAQLISLSLIWIFVTAVAIWIINLLFLAIELNDAPGASVGISIIAIPVFFTLAIILTYVFVEFHKKEDHVLTTSSEK